jgi:hypothetical protein
LHARLIKILRRARIRNRSPVDDILQGEFATITVTELDRLAIGVDLDDSVVR